MDSYLVTGGAGFIGSHLVERLVRDGGPGKAVRVLDDLSTGRRANIAHLLDRVDLIEGSICDPAAVRHAMEGAKAVFHLAAIPSVARSVEDPIETNRVNVEGTLQLLWNARQLGVKRFVFASSSSVYGESPTLPKKESMLPMPISPYGVSKLAGETYCFAFWKLFGLETVSLRLFNVFGPRQDPTSQYAAAIPRFIAAVRNDARPTVYGDGEQSRDFTFVSNVVDSFCGAAAAADAAGGVFNVACGGPITVNQLVKSVCSLLGTTPRSERVAPRPGDIRHSFADISLARARLGYEPAVAFEEGLRLTIAALKA
ncbi:MAG: SDR family oxidoreductase [Planctomycetota bacterium]|nr:SDR family oxidoreductase [Planctomycetota bacterium]